MRTLRWLLSALLVLLVLAALAALLALLALPGRRVVRRRPSRPGLPRVLSKVQRFHMPITRFRYTIEAPELAQPHDVAVRRAHVTVNGDRHPDSDLAVGEPIVIEVDVDSQVELYLTDVDAHGNESLPGPVLAFTAVDDVPPAAPGAPRVTAHEQVFVADEPPTEEPPPAEEPPPPGDDTPPPAPEA